MNCCTIRQIAAIAALGILGSVPGFAQLAQINTSPSSLTFNIVNGVTPAEQLVQVTRNGGGTGLVNISATPGIVTSVVGSQLPILPFTLRVLVNPNAFATGTTNGSITITGQGFEPESIPVTVTGGTGTGTAVFAADRSSITFSQPGGTPPGATTVTLSSSTGTIPSYVPTITYLGGVTNWLTTSPAPSTVSNSETVTVTPNTTNLTTGVYQALLNLTASGLSTISIPITLTVGNASTGTFATAPSAIAFNIPTGTQTSVSQNVLVTSDTPRAFTTSLSSNLVGLVQVTASGTTPSQIVVTVPSPELVPAGTTGSLILTPTTGGLPAVFVPISINAQGAGPLLVTAQTLTFTGVVGSSTAVPQQTLGVTSSDGSQRFFQVTTTGDFVTLSSTTAFTPSNLSVGIDMSGITEPGTYTDTITITPLTGTGAGIPTNVEVVLNAIASVTVTPNPTSVTLTAPSGSAAVQREVTLSSTVSNMPFTVAATTTSGSWLSVTAGSTTLPGTITITASPANLTPGTYSGTVTVTAQNVTVATIPVTFTVTAAAALQLSSSSLTFNHQTTNASGPAAQTVQITSGGVNIPWNAAATSGSNWLQITPSSGNTPGSVMVSVVPTGLSAGVQTGTISVSSPSASNSPRTINVTLNVTTPALPQIRQISNAASYAPTVAVPGLIITVTGTDLGPATPVGPQVSGGMVATTAGGVQVLFDGVAAPILYASATQINAVVPFEIAGRFSTRMQVVYQDLRSRDVELRVANTAPAIFTANSSGSGQGAILNQNGTYNGPGAPEQRGNVIAIYATGHGQTTPPGQTGRVLSGTEPRRPIAPVTVRIGGRTAEVTYAGSAPDLVSGALQVNARIPADTITGPNVPIQLQIGDEVSQAGVTVAIQ